MKGSRTITEVFLSLNILISFCQVSHPPFKNPGSATENRILLAFLLLFVALHIRYVFVLYRQECNRPLVKFIRNYIRDSSGVFFISSLLFVQKYSCPYNKKKITRWLEDSNFIFPWQKTLFYSLAALLRKNIVFTTRK